MRQTKQAQNGHLFESQCNSDRDRARSIFGKLRKYIIHCSLWLSTTAHIVIIDDQCSHDEIECSITPRATEREKKDHALLVSNILYHSSAHFDSAFLYHTSCTMGDQEVFWHDVVLHF